MQPEDVEDRLKLVLARLRSDRDQAKESLDQIWTQDPDAVEAKLVELLESHRKFQRFHQVASKALPLLQTLESIERLRQEAVHHLDRLSSEAEEGQRLQQEMGNVAQEALEAVQPDSGAPLRGLSAEQLDWIQKARQALGEIPSPQRGASPAPSSAPPAPPAPPVPTPEAPPPSEPVAEAEPETKPRSAPKRSAPSLDDPAPESGTLSGIMFMESLSEELVEEELFVDPTAAREEPPSEPTLDQWVDEGTPEEPEDLEEGGSSFLQSLQDAERESEHTNSEAGILEDEALDAMFEEAVIQSELPHPPSASSSPSSSPPTRSLPPAPGAPEPASSPPAPEPEPQPKGRKDPLDELLTRAGFDS